MRHRVSVNAGSPNAGSSPLACGHRKSCKLWQEECSPRTLLSLVCARGQTIGAGRDLSLRDVRGFTMLETLMVLLVGGMLLLAASSFLFGAIGLRKQIEEAPQLGQHAASVARLLEALIATAEPLQGAATAGTGAAAANTATGVVSGTASGTAADRVSWLELPSVVFGSDRALHLMARSGLPIFVGEQGLDASSVSCYLLLEKDGGLVLFWQSERMRGDDADNWERTVLSPLVVAANLLFYDAQREQWERSEGLEQPFTNPERLPQMIELVFREPHSSREVVTEVLLPPQSTQLLGL